MAAKGPPAQVEERYDVSVIVSTYNRCDVLRDAIMRLLAQEAEGLRYEIIIVDNNSTDATRQTVESFIERGAGRLRYVFEPRQGVSYGRNAGIQAARAPIVAMIDDDIRAAPDWLRTVKRVLDEHTDVDFVGGKVLPPADVRLPAWLSKQHWAPIAILDYGDAPLRLSSDNRLCLLTANIAFRREAFDRVGLFSPDLQRVKDGIGSMEDLELQMRVWRAGGRGLYAPEIVVVSEVPADRLTRAYHRRWHRGHGHLHAMLRSEEMERSRAGRLFDVPAHLYRQAIRDAAQWVKYYLTGNRAAAFAPETRLCFFAGFFRKRRRDYLATPSRTSLGEIAAFLRSAARSRRAGGTQKETS